MLCHPFSAQPLPRALARCSSNAELESVAEPSKISATLHKLQSHSSGTPQQPRCGNLTTRICKITLQPPSTLRKQLSNR